MDYDLRNFLTTTRETVTPALISSLIAKRDEEIASAALLEAQLAEQEYRNRNRNFRA